MIVQNDYKPLLIFGLVVLGGFVALGGLVNEKVNQTNAVPQAPAVEMQQAFNSNTASTNQAVDPPVIQATATPAIQPVLVALAQATIARVTQSAVEFQATQTSIAAKQTEIAAQQTRVAEQFVAQKTRDDQEAAARASQAASENDKRNNENTREMLINLLMTIAGIGMIGCAGFIVVIVARIKQKEAEAKAYVEQRRLLEVKAGILAKQERQNVQTSAASPQQPRIPRNGHGEQEDAAIA